MFYRLHIVVFLFLATHCLAQIPNREWSTYHGGTSEDSFRDMAIDAGGNVYVVGSTKSSNSISTPASYQPAKAGGSDVFIAKYDTDGNKIWATYFGGSGDDFGQSIDLDANGNIFVTGLTFSINGIATVGTHQNINNGSGDVFIAKLDNNGFRIWGSYLGGSGFDFANDIEVDFAGNPIIVGWTNSNNNITSPGAYQTTYTAQDDILLAKFNTNGQRLWATYYGDIGFDTGLQVESDGLGNIIFSGWTSSLASIASPGAFQTSYGGNTADGFLTVFTSNGTRLWSTYYGGNGDDYGDALLVSQSGDIYLSGFTNSPNNITSPGAFQQNLAFGYDAFLARFSVSGSRFWSTYFGGNRDDTAFRLREGNDAAVYMLGHTSSSDVMATPGAYQVNKSAFDDVFLSRFEIDGRLTWSTYYGGTSNDLGYGLVIDANDDIFICGVTEGSTNLSTTGAPQPAFGGGTNDGFVSKFSPCSPPILNFTNSGFTCGPVNYIFEFELLGQSPFTIYYNIDGVPQVPWITDNNNFFPTVNANLWTKTIQIDSVKSGNCKGIINSQWGFVQVRDSIRATNPVINCDPSTSTYTITVDLSGGAFGDFNSVGPNGGFINIITDRFISLPIPFTEPYFIQFTEVGTFSNCDTITFKGVSGCVDPCPPLNIQATSNSPICLNKNISLMTSGGSFYEWQGPNGFTSNMQNPVIASATINNSGIYSVTVTDNNGCTGVAATSIIVNPSPLAIASSNSPVCFGTNIIITASGGNAYIWSGPNNFSGNTATALFSNANSAYAGTYFVTVTNNFGCTSVTSVDVVITNQLNINTSSNSPVCVGKNINLMASGGNVYQWSGPDGFTSNQQNPVINNITLSNAGTYIVTVTSLGNCQSTASTTVNVNNIANITVSSNSPICSDAVLNLLASGGISYQWSGPNSFNSTAQNPVINNTSIINAGTYVVTVTGTGGCTSTSATTVIVNQSPVAVLSSNSPVCNGGNLAFQLSGGISYTWSGPNNFASTSQNPVINNATSLLSGTYFVTITSQNNCTATASTNVIVQGQLTANVSSNSPVCEGDTLRLNADGGISYIWNGPNGFNASAASPIIPDVREVASGSYLLTVSDVSGCTGTRQLVVVIKNRPNAIISGISEICQGESLILQSPTVGNLLWSNGSTTQSIVVMPDKDQTFTLYADEDGCKDTTSISVKVFISPDVILNLADPIIIIGASVQLIASGANQYAWTPGFGLSCTECPNPLASPLETTTYCVTGIVNGCKTDTCVNITVTEPCLLIFPNIFSPNGDGVNDTWCSQSRECISFQTLSVYDRWGNLLHTSSGSEVCWDGNTPGYELQNQVCTYLLQINKNDGKIENRYGSITLIK